MPRAPAALDGMVQIKGRRFLTGADEHCPEGAPDRPVQVDPCFADRQPVTNERFAAFVVRASRGATRPSAAASSWRTLGTAVAVAYGAR